MGVDQDHSPNLKAACYIVRSPGKPSQGWEWQDKAYHPLVQHRDFWALLKMAFERGHEQVTVKDGLDLYLVKIVQID